MSSHFDFMEREAGVIPLEGGPDIDKFGRARRAAKMNTPTKPQSTEEILRPYFERMRKERDDQS